LGGEVVAYGLGIVVGVVGVVSDGAGDGSGGGTISAALWVGEDGVSLVGVMSVVLTGRDVVDVVVDVVRAGAVEVVRVDGTAGADGWWRELCAV
jgi:hypothetical protein